MSTQSERLSAAGLLPVVVLDDAAHAVPLADILLSSGIPAAEITFRTDAAAASIAAIARERPSLLLGAGTVLTLEQAQTAVDAGAQFIVTPGLDAGVVRWCLERGVPVYPGVCTPTEITAALALGLTTLKFFPAEQSGGTAMLKALSGPFGQVKFIPTGGISAQNLGSYLALSNVLCCGGSFMLPPALLHAGRFDELAALCREAGSSLSRLRRKE